MIKHLIQKVEYFSKGYIISTFFSKDGNFQLDQLKHSSQFEKRDRLNFTNKINKEDFLKFKSAKNTFQILVY